MVRSVINHARKRSGCRWYWRVTSRIMHKDMLQFELYRENDVMLSLSSGLCSWIKKGARICSRRHLLSLQMNAGCVNESTQWSGCMMVFFYCLRGWSSNCCIFVICRLFRSAKVFFSQKSNSTCFTISVSHHSGMDKWYKKQI